MDKEESSLTQFREIQTNEAQNQEAEKPDQTSLTSFQNVEIGNPSTSRSDEALNPSLENPDPASAVTGQVFSKKIEITPQIHIKKFEEQTARGRVSCWESFCTSTASTLAQRTLWMSEMTPNNAPFLKPHVL